MLSVWFAGGKWQAHRLLAVVIAVSGVFLIVYGGSSQSVPREGSTITSSDIFGDLLTLIASLAYSLYQVLYKLYATLPEEPLPDESPLSPAYERIGVGDGERTSYFDPGSPLRTNRSFPPSPPVARPRVISSPSHASFLRPSESLAKTSHAPVYPTFGLHPNLLTTCIGLYTLVFLWIPIPILHYIGIETFRLPPNWQTWVSILMTALCGVCYNAGFMVRWE